MSFSPLETSYRLLPFRCQVLTRRHLPISASSLVCSVVSMRLMREKIALLAAAAEMAGLKLAIGQVFGGASISKACQSTYVADEKEGMKSRLLVQLLNLRGG